MTIIFIGTFAFAVL